MKTLFVRWLDSFDPFGIQRLLFYKCLYIAVLLMVVNVIYKPEPFGAYFWPPMMIILVYESPAILKERDKLFYFLLVYVICAVAMVSFYLLYPYKIIFTIYAVLFYFIYFHLSSRYWQEIANSIFVVYFIASSMMVVMPAMSLQVAFNMFFAVLLSMLVVLFGIKTFPNYTLYIWHRVFIGFLQSLVGETISELSGDGAKSSESYVKIVFHLNIIRNIRHSLKKQHLNCCMRIIVYLRDLHIALEYASIKRQDQEFWRYIENSLIAYLEAIKDWQPFKLLPYNEYTKDFKHEHQQVLGFLTKSINSWNKLCLIK